MLDRALREEREVDVDLGSQPGARKHRADVAGDASEPALRTDTGTSLQEM